jgi:predicted nucleotidyltransferase
LSSSEVRYLKINFDEILSKLREYADSKAKDQHARAIVLTGSLATGSYTGTSDADILVITDNVPANVLERYAPFSDPEFPIDLEPRVYTTEEFLTLQRLKLLDSCFFMLRTPAIAGCSTSEAEAMPVACYR